MSRCPHSVSDVGLFLRRQKAFQGGVNKNDPLILKGPLILVFEKTECVGGLCIYTVHYQIVSQFSLFLACLGMLVELLFMRSMGKYVLRDWIEQFRVARICKIGFKWLS